MQEAPRSGGAEDPRNRLAAERTLLAWIRTGITVMGFGFVVARFGLILRELGSSDPLAARRPSGFSTWIGVAFVLVGVIINLAAAAEHRRLLGRLSRQEPYVPPRRSLAVIAAAVLAILGLGMAVYLLVTWR